VSVKIFYAQATSSISESVTISAVSSAGKPQSHQSWRGVEKKLILTDHGNRLVTTDDR
jgi:hypothetical protein